MSSDTQRPPRGWEIQTWLLVGLAVTTAAAGLVELLTLVAISDANAAVPLVTRFATVLDAVYLVLTVACLGVFVWWRSSTRQLLRSIGDDEHAGLKHWTPQVALRLLTASIAIRVIGNFLGRDDPAMLLFIGGLGLAVRMLALTVTAIGVWRIWTGIRTTMATPPAPRTQTPSQWSTATRPTSLDTTDLPPADDDFWNRVRSMSLAANGELPLLESTSTVIRRWTLIPSASDIDEIRRALRPGTVVTVFPTPPQPVGTPLTVRFIADEDVELLSLSEDAETGMLWFQLLQPSRVDSWLAKARSAKRYALFRADDPAAATAVVPAQTAHQPAPAG